YAVELHGGGPGERTAADRYSDPGRPRGRGERGDGGRRPGWAGDRERGGGGAVVGSGAQAEVTVQPRLQAVVVVGRAVMRPGGDPGACLHCHDMLWRRRGLLP